MQLGFANFSVCYPQLAHPNSYTLGRPVLAWAFVNFLVDYAPSAQQLQGSFGHKYANTTKPALKYWNHKKHVNQQSSSAPIGI